MTPIETNNSRNLISIDKKIIASTQDGTGAVITASKNSNKPADSKRSILILSDEEKSLYGDRCPEEYEKIELLGKYLEFKITEI